MTKRSIVPAVLLLAWVVFVTHRDIAALVRTPSSRAGAAVPAATSGGATLALAPGPDAAAYAVTLQPPRLNSGASDDHVFVAHGTLQPGASERKTFVLPATTRVTAMLVGEGVRYVFRSPRGETWVPGETPDRAGFESTGGAHGVAGFILDHAASGQWTVTIEAERPGGWKAYAVDVTADGASDETPHLETVLEDSDPRLSLLAAPSDPVFVRAYVTRGGRPVRGVRWDIQALTPRNRRVAIPVYDDGRHADGTANDGVSVGAVVAEGPDGFYQIRAEGRMRGGAAHVVTGHFEVQAKNDLLIADSIAFEPPDVTAGRPVSLWVTVMNDGTVDSHGIELEFYLGTRKVSSQTFDLKGGESKRVATSWTPAEPGTYVVQLTINPFLEPSGADFANNTRMAVVTVR